MFKKFKDRLTEVSEEVKKDPRFVNGIASVNQLVKKKLFETQSVVLDSVFSQIFLTLQAQQTVAAIKNDKIEGSNESLNYQQQTPSFSQLQETDNIPFGAEAGLSQTHKRSRSNDLQDYFSSSSAFEANSNTLQASPPVLANYFGFLNSVKTNHLSKHSCPVLHVYTIGPNLIGLVQIVFVSF